MTDTIERKPDPRNNADDAYEAFMGMERSEWFGLLSSLIQGGVLTPAEQIGFKRAEIERRVPTPEPLFVLRLWDMFDGWMDIGEVTTKTEADAAWAEHTDDGKHNTCYADGDYYKVFPADTTMVFTPERMGR